MMNKTIIIECENMREEDLKELYYQLSIKTSPYGITMSMNEKVPLGKIVMNSKGLKNLAHSMELIYGEETIINLPVWKDNKSNLFFQLEKKSGKINCVYH